MLVQKLTIPLILFSLVLMSYVSHNSTSRDLTYKALKNSLLNEQDSLTLDIKIWDCGITCDEANLPVLNGLLDYLKEHPYNIFQIETYTDCRGGDLENVSLSLKRSEMIRSWLIEKGLIKERIVAKGFGGRRPLVACNCPECTPLEHVANRRVVIRLLNIFSSEGLSDRIVLEKPWLKQQDHFKGKVAVRVCISKRGKVTSSELAKEETTATNKDYIDKVLSIVKEWRFTNSQREIQCGMITYDYNLE